MAIIGNPIVSTDFPKDTFSGNGSTTAFTMQIAPASVNSVIVVVSGITQDPSTYTISGTTLTFSAAPPTGTNNISVRHLGVAGIPNTPSAGSVVATSIADGVITAAKFASGQTPSFNGITFPVTQVPSADANTLDDYEEGTWTPGLTFGGNSVGMGLVAYRTGCYTKVGNIVNAYCYVALNAKGSSTGIVSVTNFPFTSSSYAGYAYGAATVWMTAGTGVSGSLMGYIVPNTTKVDILYLQTGSQSGLTDSNCTNSTEFMVNVTYRVA